MNFVEECGSIVAINSVNQEKVGEIAFTRIGDDLVSFDHADVNPDYQGQGIAGELVAKAVELTRKEKRKIIPKCPYAAHVFANNKDYADCLA